MKKFINTLLGLLFIVSVIWLIMAFVRWYSLQSLRRKRLYCSLFFIYMLLLLLSGL